MWFMGWYLFMYYSNLINMCFPSLRYPLKLFCSTFRTAAADKDSRLMAAFCTRHGSQHTFLDSWDYYQQCFRVDPSGHGVKLQLWKSSRNSGGPQDRRRNMRSWGKILLNESRDYYETVPSLNLPVAYIIYNHVIYPFGYISNLASNVTFYWSLRDCLPAYKLEHNQRLTSQPLSILSQLFAR